MSESLPTEPLPTESLPTTLSDFYPYYLSQHRDPRNRIVHYIGTALGIVTAGATLAAGHVVLAPFVGLAVAYGILWPFGHMLFEGNVPASLTGRGVSQRAATVLRSVCCDFFMGFRALTGRLEGDFERFGIEYRRDRGRAR